MNEFVAHGSAVGRTSRPARARRRRRGGGARLLVRGARPGLAGLPVRRRRGRVGAAAVGDESGRLARAPVDPPGRRTAAGRLHRDGGVRRAGLRHEPSRRAGLRRVLARPDPGVAPARSGLDRAQPGPDDPPFARPGHRRCPGVRRVAVTARLARLLSGSSWPPSSASCSARPRTTASPDHRGSCAGTRRVHSALPQPARSAS